MVRHKNFRPLSGIVFSIYSQEVRETALQVAFPSPLGDCVFNQWQATLEKENNLNFRPLSGIVFSIVKKSIDKTTARMLFPSPLGDCVFNLAALYR